MTKFDNDNRELTLDELDCISGGGTTDARPIGSASASETTIPLGHALNYGPGWCYWHPYAC
jgi:hypothetical protein